MTGPPLVKCPKWEDYYAVSSQENGSIIYNYTLFVISLNVLFTLMPYLLTLEIAFYFTIVLFSVESQLYLIIIFLNG